MRRRAKRARPVRGQSARLLSQNSLPATMGHPRYDPIAGAAPITSSFSVLPGGSGFKPVF